MFVANYMTTEPTTVLSEASVEEARILMRERRIGHLPVVDEGGTFVGLMTRCQLSDASAGSRCADIMTPRPVTVSGGASLIYALRLMCERHRSGLPVVSKTGQLEGIITRGDLLGAMCRLLGLDRPGSCIEMGLLDRADDPVSALDTLRKCGIEPLSVVVGNIRDDDDEPAFYVRVPKVKLVAAEQALSRAGLVLLVPENQERSLPSTSAGAAISEAAPAAPSR